MTRAIFDGHNDAITRDDHALIVEGRPDGHLDLPRMCQAGVRGAIFAVFALMGAAASLIARILHRYPWIGYAGVIIVFYVACRMIYGGAIEMLHAT